MDELVKKVVGLEAGNGVVSHEIPGVQHFQDPESGWHIVDDGHHGEVLDHRRQSEHAQFVEQRGTAGVVAVLKQHHHPSEGEDGAGAHVTHPAHTPGHELTPIGLLRGVWFSQQGVCTIDFFALFRRRVVFVVTFHQKKPLHRVERHCLSSKMPLFK